MKLMPSAILAKVDFPERPKAETDFSNLFGADGRAIPGPS